MTLVDRQHIRQLVLLEYVACNSDSKILAVLPPVETLYSLYPRASSLTPISFRCCRSAGPGQGFFAIRIPVRLSSGIDRLSI